MMFCNFGIEWAFEVAHSQVCTDTDTQEKHCTASNEPERARVSTKKYININKPTMVIGFASQFVKFIEINSLSLIYQMQM